MASEYVSFMILFGLGITMVVAVGVTVSNVETGIVGNVANIELMEILSDIKKDLVSGISASKLQLQTGESYSFQSIVDLPLTLAKSYYYTISVEATDSGIYYLEGRSNGIGPSYLANMTLPFSNLAPGFSYIITGSFDSSFLSHIISFTKSGDNPLVITLRDSSG